ncbi:aminomethyltransferase [Streptomyces sp. cf124]|uniref:aminomethyltransferase family protein n=1 Tax=unclassified Streptomyces TaxID=2593676 RepID=UPI0005EDCC95|nr:MULTISPECIES: aminomethyltransferase family protein [unclassified Streptomyces]SFO05187.1 aminomethyltransferase [Streptomyces sp. cf124]
MHFTVDAFRSTPPFDVLAKLFGQPEHTDWLDESLSWKRTCYIGDWSFLPQTRFRGPGVPELFSGISVNSLRRFPAGASKHIVQTNAHGHVMSEGILTRLDEEDYVFHGPGGDWGRYNLEHGDFQATAEDEDWFVYQVSGPASIPLLLDLTGDDRLLDTPYMHAVPTALAGHRVWALRQGMAGEVGFELQGPREIGCAVYDAVVQAGQKYGIRRLGNRAAPINHLENAVPTRNLDYLPALYEPEQADFLAHLLSSPWHIPRAFIAGSFQGESLRDYYRDPVELGWTRQISFDHTFLGDAALMERLAKPARVLRTLVWNSDDVLDLHRSLYGDGPHHTFMDMPRDLRGHLWMDRVERDGVLAGTATSRGYSYYFRKMLSLAVLNVADAEIGTQVDVVWGNPGDPVKRIRATVAKAPFKRVRSRAELHAHLAAYRAESEPAA